MNDHRNSTDRTSREYLLLAGAFLGFIITVAGVVIASAFLAVSGLCMLLVAVSCFGFASGN
jgi:hypothetical protein